MTSGEICVKIIKTYGFKAEFNAEDILCEGISKCLYIGRKL